MNDLVARSGRTRPSATSRAAVRCLALGLVGIAVLLGAADSAGAADAPTLLPQYDLSALQQPRIATEALAAVGREEDALRRRAEAARLACYDRFAVNACLNRVESGRRDDERRLRWIRTEANRALRQQRAVEQNERLAAGAAGGGR